MRCFRQRGMLLRLLSGFAKPTKHRIMFDQILDRRVSVKLVAKVVRIGRRGNIVFHLAVIEA